MRISLASLLLITFYVSTTLFGVALSDTQCGLNCATQITAVTACQNTNNRTCMCQDYDYATKYRGCIQRACLQNDLLAVFKADGAACAALGIEMTQPAPGVTSPHPLLPPKPTTNVPTIPDATNTSGTMDASGGNSGNVPTGGSGLISAASSITVVKGFSFVASLAAVVIVFAGSI